MDMRNSGYFVNVIGVAQNIKQSRLLVILYSLLISRNLKKTFGLPGEL